MTTASQTPVSQENRKQAIDRLLGSDLFVLVLIAVMVVVLLPFAGQLLSPGNLTNIASNYWPLLLVVLGQTFVLITAGIDLSQVAILAVTNVMGAMLITEAAGQKLLESSPFSGLLFGSSGGVLGHSPGAVVAAWLIMVLIGGLIGMFNGFAVARIGMPPFMVTLTTMLFFIAFAVWATQSENVRNLPQTYSLLANDAVAAIVGLASAVIAYVILSKTLLGRWLYAIGINKEAAEVSGVPVHRVTMAAYALSGMFTAVGAALYSARLDAGRPTLGATLLMDVIGAAVIGGVSLFGGRGRVLGAALGVLLFVVLTNALNLVGLPFYTIMWIKGLIILAAVSIDSYRSRRAEARI